MMVIIVVVVLADVAFFVVLSGSSSNINIFGCSQENFFIFLSSGVLWQSFGDTNYPVLWHSGELLQETSHACSICTLASCSIAHHWPCVIGGLHGQHWVSQLVFSISTWKRQQHQILSGKRFQIPERLLVHVGYHGQVSKFKLIESCLWAPSGLL